MKANIAQEQVPQAALVAIARLEQLGFAAYLVGGCVRDLLLKRAPGDVDMATSALPAEIISAFASFPQVLAGLKHGTVTVIWEGVPVEITTFRLDGNYSDSRHPDEVRFSRELAEDISRRDFTVNGFAWNPRTGLFGPDGGLDDLQSGILRCIGDPRRRFQEDALRILRGFRFMAQLSFTFADGMEDALRETAPLLRHISAERIGAELSKLLLCQSPSAALRLMNKLSVLPWILPPLLESGLAEFDRAESVLPVRLALLFASLPAEEAAARLSQLRLDKKTREQTLALLRCKKAAPPENSAELKRMLREYSPEGFLRYCSFSAAKTLDTGEREAFLQARREAEALLCSGECWSRGQLAVRGGELASLGISGPAMGELLDCLTDEVAAGRLPNEKGCLLDWAKQWRKNSKV